MNLIDEYFTIKKESEFELKEKSSKFIGLAFPVSGLEHIEEKIKSNSKKYYDATHNCFAYRIGLDKNQFRYSDAGEPSGTAGKPIMSVIDNHKLTDILIIVNRYFGGTKLGVSGLYKAYFGCAEGVIQNSEIITKIIYDRISIVIDHNLMNIVMRTISGYSGKIINQIYDERAHLSVEIRKTKTEEFKNNLLNLTNARITFE